MATRSLMQLKSIMLLGIAGATFTGCVTLGNGKVSKVVSNKEVDVTTIDENLKVGDAVQLITNGSYIPRHGYQVVKLGEGKVISVSNNTARVNLDNEANFSDVSSTIFAQKTSPQHEESRPKRWGRFE